jgi:hypothetical protein
MDNKIIYAIVFVAGALFFLERSKPPAAPAPPAEKMPASSFAGYNCTEDCSGHKAGYEWAEQYDIDDDNDCDTAGDHSDAQSFAEGCKAFVNGDNSANSDGDDEDETNDDDSAITVPSELLCA